MLMNNTLRLIHVFTFLSGIVLVALLVSIVSQNRDIWMFFNSDTLYLPSIYLDVFVHGTGISGWHLNASPNFFPDIIAYIGLMGILKETALTSLVFSMIQFGAVMVLINYFFKAYDPAASIETRILINLVMVLYVLSSVSGEDLVIPFQLLVPSYHCGFFINTLLCLILGVNYLRGGKVASLILTGIIVFLAVISDRLFLISLVFPMFIVMIVSKLRNIKDSRSMILFAVILTSSMLGMLIFRLIGVGGSLHFIGTDWKMFNFQNMGASFNHLFTHMRSVIVNQPVQRWLIIFALLFFITAPIYLIIFIGSFIKDRLEMEKQHHFRLILIMLTMSLALFFTPVINGSYLGPAHIRYNFPALIIGSVGFIYLLLLYLNQHRRFQTFSGYLSLLLSLGLLVIMIQSGFKHHAIHGIKEFVNHYPEKSRILDSLKVPYDLKYGISNYWHAKHSTIFSKNDVRVYAVFEEDLKPYYHVINENWYHDGGKGLYADPVFNFIYADAGTTSIEKVEEVFGNNLDTIFVRDGARVIKLPEFKYDRTTKDIILLNPEDGD